MIRQFGGLPLDEFGGGGDEGQDGWPRELAVIRRDAPQFVDDYLGRPAATG
jgi:hypothetical protein